MNIFAMPSKQDTIKLLEEIADMLEFKGENRFKVQAYRAGASSIKKFQGDFDKIVQQDELNKIRGIGAGLQKIIYEFYKTNECQLYKNLRDEIPEGLEGLLKIKGLNSKNIRQLYSELGIKSLDDLEKATQNNLLITLRGFGDSLQNKILSSLKDYKKYRKFILINTALSLSDEILSKLNNIKSLEKVEKSGELRRGSEIISRLDFVILTSNKAEFLKELKTIFNYSKIENSLVIEGYADVPISFIITCTNSQYSKQLFLTTGSEGFLDSLNRNKIKGSKEENIFLNMNYPFVIPEMREREFFQQKKSLRKNSTLTINDLRGLLHLHTTDSDGRNSLEEMIDAAVELDFEYASINDHSKTAYYANGLDEKRNLQQIKELRKISLQKGFPVFAGVEVDILVSGDMDYSNDFLSNFDFIIASVHTRFSLEEREMTKRIIRAVENPYVDVLGHPTGRLLLSRAPYKLDIKKVIDACSSNDVAIEINSSPKRLDLEWRWIYYAREKGCLISINTDAHSISEISFLFYGIIMGRKAGIQPREIINCFSLNNFKKYLNRKVKRNLK